MRKAGPHAQGQYAVRKAGTLCARGVHRAVRCAQGAYSDAQGAYADAQVAYANAQVAYANAPGRCAMLEGRTLMSKAGTLCARPVRYGQRPVGCMAGPRTAELPGRHERIISYGSKVRSGPIVPQQTTLGSTYGPDKEAKRELNPMSCAHYRSSTCHGISSRRPIRRA
jgi:hypothetical protein